MAQIDGYINNDGDFVLDVTPGQESSEPADGGLPYINDTSNDQLADLTGNDLVDIEEPDPTIPDVPVPEEEPIYRKRLLKIDSSGKIVERKIVYIRRFCISQAGGFGDGYLFGIPAVENGKIVGFTPVKLNLSGEPE